METKNPPQDPEAALLALREPFSKDVIGLLPKATKRNVPESEKRKCEVCGAYIGPHIHLDYVGHAAVTDRLLSNDLSWTWEPLATDAEGLPVYREAPNGLDIELWIRLTVRGVTRVGVGVVEKSKQDLGKQLVSDALKNAAMRFGVALDLWTKDELESQLTDTTSSTRKRKAPKTSKSEVREEDAQGNPIPRDPATEGEVPFDSRARNKVILHFKRMDPPVEVEDIPAKVMPMLGLLEPVPLAKLTSEQGKALMESLGITE